MANCKEVVDELRATFKTGKTLPIEFRVEQLKQLQKMIEENRDQISAAVLKDLGRQKAETEIFEILVVLNEIKCHLQNLYDWMKPKKVSRSLTALMDSTFTVHDPLGVVLLIAPWNFPVQLSLVPLIGAISAGNCAILKPSELSAASSKWIAETLPRYLDPHVYKVIEGGVAETTELLKQRYDHIFYTGSTPVGKVILRAAAEHLTPATLELGGKCPCIIDKDTDLNTAARRISWGKWVNNGQICLAVDYILLVGDKTVQDKLIEELKSIIKEFYGDDVKKAEFYSRIINERHFDRIKKILDNTKATKVIGGNQTDRDDKYIEPTVLTNVQKDDIVMQDELFAPILPIFIVESIDAAIDFVNEGEKPLGLYFFSHNKENIDKVLTHTSSGGVTINDILMHITQDTLPFGGVGCSGMGRHHGKFSFDTFTHEKSVMHRGTSGERMNTLRYPPFTESKLGWAKTLMDRKMVPFS